MADAFEDFLSAALAPPERAGDRQFIARVQAAIALEEQLAAQRRAIVREALTQILALASVAAALWWLSRAPPVARWLADTPAQALSILVVMFAFVVAAFVLRPVAASRRLGIGALSSWT